MNKLSVRPLLLACVVLLGLAPSATPAQAVGAAPKLPAFLTGAFAPTLDLSNPLSHGSGIVSDPSPVTDTKASLCFALRTYRFKSDTGSHEAPHFKDSSNCQSAHLLHREPAEIVPGAR